MYFIIIPTFLFTINYFFVFLFFFSSRRRHTRYIGDWSSDVCSSDLVQSFPPGNGTYAITMRSGLDTTGVSFLNYYDSVANYVVSSGWNLLSLPQDPARSEERRVGKECRSRWSRDQWKKKVCSEVEEA